MMNQLNFMLLTVATIAASAYGSGVNTYHAEEDTIREAGASTRHRHHVESMAGDDFDSINVYDDHTQRRMYISEAGNLVDILGMTEEDRASSSAPPLHFEIEVDLLSPSSAENDQDLSHFRRLQSSTSTLLLQLATANSAITPSTTFDFRSVTLSDSSLASKLTVLVNDPTKTRGITAMSVNTSTGKVSGIQRGRSGNVRKLDMFDIQGGEIVEALKPQMRMFMGGVKRAKHESFTCGVEHKEEWDDRRRLRQDDDDDEWKGVRGNVDANMDHHDHEHNHDEHLHDDIDHFRMLQNSNAAFKPPTSERLYESGGPSVRFQINIIIDIDAEFIQKHGGADEAIEYVNFLVTVANTILMNEVGLMLNVVHVQEVTYFESAVTLREGLKLMKDQYDGKFPGIQLRHALLGKYIGGGIAFIDTVCDKRYAVGLSSGLEGSIGHLDHDAVYDLFIFLHEIGHSLGSDHTFEEAFKPRVDTCGLDRCPKALPQANSASIMSYCDFCSGGLSNVALSMGGRWTGEHPRLAVRNWIPSKEIESSSVSTKPERVSHQIWKTLYSKGQCVVRQTDAPTPGPSYEPTSFSPTKHPSKSPTQEPTQNPITISPTSSSPTSSSPTVRPTVNYGPFNLSPLKTCEDNCYLSRGIMFDVMVGNILDNQGILIESIAFEHTNTYTDVSVDLYRTFVGGHQGKVNYSAQWSKIDSIEVIQASLDPGAVTGSYATSEFKLIPPVAISADKTLGFYLRASTSILRVGAGSNAHSDSNGVALGIGSTVMGGVFGVGVEGYLFNVDIKYSIARPTNSPSKNPTSEPNKAPTKQPTTENPTGKPSKAPTKQPITENPTNGQSNRPSIDSQSTTSLFASPTVPSYWLDSSKFCTSNCLPSSGFMFDVNLKLSSTHKMLVKSIEFEHLRGNSNPVLDVYTTYHGSLNGAQPNQWKKSLTVSLPNLHSNTTAVFDPAISLWPGTTQGFYLSTNEGIMLVGLGSSDNSDGNGVSIQDGNVVFGEFGKAYPGYHLNFRLGYDIHFED